MRVQVGADRRPVPPGTTTVHIAVETNTGERVDLELPVTRAADVPARGFTGFIETDGHVAIEAPNFSRSVAGSGAEWTTLEEFGRTLGGVTPIPVSAATQTSVADAPRLEYDLRLFSTGDVAVELQVAPSLDFQPEQPLRVALRSRSTMPRRRFSNWIRGRPTRTGLAPSPTAFAASRCNTASAIPAGTY